MSASSNTVAVIGAGKVGAAVAHLLARAGHDVVVWARRTGAAAEIAQSASADERVRTARSIAEACRGASLVTFAVPAHALREAARAAGEVADGAQVALHACRGVDVHFALPHDVIRAETCIKKIAALGGPLYFDDLAQSGGRPLVAVVASRFDEVHRLVKALVKNTQVRVHSTHDVVGVEVAGAVSNVAHMAAGIAEGLGLGETDQGVLLTRGLVEAARIGGALGGERTTFAGLAGVGDLIPRPVTSTKRHRTLGAELGAPGKDAGAVLALHKDVEGVSTAREAQALGKRLELSLPLVDAVCDVLAGQPPRAVLERVLSLDLDIDGITATT
ncbi:MAG TPA: NAD(P)-binding domain-containing protein [Myxococcota bacterium]|jgi:glycerol-3-phosphate dehydrogenase (NAD(P)+)